MSRDPVYVKTRIVDAGRNRPDGVTKTMSPKEIDKEWTSTEADPRFITISPEHVADRVYNAIRNEQFYILTHPASEEWVCHVRMEDIINERNPIQFFLIRCH